MLILIKNPVSYTHLDVYKRQAYYIKFYHDLGFHILLPDNRAHGESEGTYIGFGWLDRLDCIQWIHQVKDYFHKDLQIVLHGISMGSATVLMASGEELPDDVKCIISDCGFTSVLDEFKHELHQRHIPASLVLPTATLLSKKRVGYSFKEASTIEQVKKSKTPTLFIHGDRDNFVPTYMVYDLYNACSADKDLLIVEGAGHAPVSYTHLDVYKRQSFGSFGSIIRIITAFLIICSKVYNFISLFFHFFH